MSPFVRVNPGDLIQAQNLNQVVGSLNGTSGQGVAIAQTSVNDASNYALSVQNLEATNSRALNVLKSDGTLLIRADVNGVNLGNTTITGPTLSLPAASITNAELGPDVARANQLTNGGFEIWQRGNGPYTTQGAYCADRWILQIMGTDTLSVSRSGAGNGDVGSIWAAAANFTLGSGAGQSAIYQQLKLTTDNALQGKTLVFSLRVLVSGSAANVTRIELKSDGTGAQDVFSPFNIASAGYQTLVTPAINVPGNATAVTVAVYFAATNSTILIDNANLVVGSQPANYVPLHPADDLARCLRYYERIDAANNQAMVSGGQAYSVSAMTMNWPLKVIKAVVPTLTFAAGNQFAALSAAGGQIVGTSIAGANTGSDRASVTLNVASGLVAGNASNLIAANPGTAYMIAEANP